MNYRYFRKYRKNPNPISPDVETEKKCEKKVPWSGTKSISAIFVGISRNRVPGK
jgi:hypothetical protein